nr:MFS transporter [Nocardiopsis ansamitocini]
MIAAGVGLAAINLRTGITSIGPLLDEITTGLGMSAVMAGLLTTLPVLCFALFGALTPTLIRRAGEHRVILGALAALTAGLTLRAFVGDQWLFLLFSALALSGGAVGNVLLPTLVKQHFPHRVGIMTTVYTTAIAMGATIAAAGTVPLTAATGDWRLALAAFAVFGLIAAVPWALVMRHDPPRSGKENPTSVRAVLRTPMGWQSIVFFGTQAAIAYIMFGWFAQLLRDNGMSPTDAGLALSYLTALSIPISLLLPAIMARVGDQRPFVALFAVCYVIGCTGLVVAPVAGVWAWATLIGLGMGTFPLALTFFAVRTRGPQATAALSAATQSIGYLIAGTGPFLFGLLHELTGSWYAPGALLLLLAVSNAAVGFFLGRPLHLEDQIRLPEASPAGR